MIFISCKEVGLWNDVRRFYGSAPVFPHQMTLVSSDTTEVTDFSVTNPLLVVYYSSSECSTCVIPSLKLMESLNSYILEVEGVDIVFILSPDKRHNTSQLIEPIQRLRLSFPVFIDGERFITKKNRIPKDRRAQIFLLDKKGVVVYVGNPILSETLGRLFQEALINLI